LADGTDKVWCHSVFTLSSRRSPIIDPFRDYMLRLQAHAANRWLAQLPDDIVIVAVAYPPATYLSQFLRFLDHDLLIADLVDDMIEKAEGKVKENFIDNYRSVLPKCRYVFSTSPVLARKYRDYARQEIEFLPNGVDPSEFLVESPPDLHREKNRPIVGYVGSINQTMDVEVLEHVVASYPEVDFNLIGFASPNRLEQLNNMANKCSNLHFLGRRHFTEVPASLAGFDVLANFKKRDSTTVGNDSMKVYEYLATGKPIVSLPISPADRFPDLIYVASNKEQFVECLSKALEEKGTELREARVEAARKESWEKRVNVILEKLQICAQ
jgi:glycosyltransferase involved in cell wall biosynthesis